MCYTLLTTNRHFTQTILILYISQDCDVVDITERSGEQRDWSVDSRVIEEVEAVALDQFDTFVPTKHLFPRSNNNAVILTFVLHRRFLVVLCPAAACCHKLR